MRVQIDLSAGELIDRITILELKTQHIADSRRLRLLEELATATKAYHEHVHSSSALEELMEALRHVNRELWDTEEEIRQCERQHSFGSRFIELARRTYKANDRRAALKQRISALLGDEHIEFKSHELPTC